MDSLIGSQIVLLPCDPSLRDTRSPPASLRYRGSVGDETEVLGSPVETDSCSFIHQALVDASSSSGVWFVSIGMFSAGIMCCFNRTVYR